jgi:hypothetical protein
MYFLSFRLENIISSPVVNQKSVDLCGDGFEYLHCDPASRRRRREGKSQIWDSKIWSLVRRDSDPRKITLARPSFIYKRQSRPPLREGAPQYQNRNCQTRHQDLLTDRHLQSENENGVSQGRSFRLLNFSDLLPYELQYSHVNKSELLCHCAVYCTVLPIANSPSLISCDSAWFNPFSCGLFYLSWTLSWAAYRRMFLPWISISTVLFMVR